MKDTEMLIKALELWLQKLTPKAYPATAVERLISKLRLGGMPKFTRGDRQMAITALSRFGPRQCPLRDRLEKEEDATTRRAPPPIPRQYLREQS